MARAGDPAYPEKVWRRFLELVDEELPERRKLVLVGGAAISLRYARRHDTGDMDSITSTRDTVLWNAIQRARRRLKAELGLEKAPPVGTPGGAFDPPENYEERLEQILPTLMKLRVYVPERHDLALMKTSRGLGRDTEALLAMHKAEPFQLATLIERYRETQAVFVGDPRRLRLNFLTLVSTLFGHEKSVELEDRGLV